MWHSRLLLCTVLLVSQQLVVPQASCTKQDPACGADCADDIRDAPCDNEEDFVNPTVCPSLFQGSYHRQRVPFQTDHKVQPLEEETEESAKGDSAQALLQEGGASAKRSVGLRTAPADGEAVALKGISHLQEEVRVKSLPDGVTEEQPASGQHAQATQRSAKAAQPGGSPAGPPVGLKAALDDGEGVALQGTPRLKEAHKPEPRGRKLALKLLSYLHEMKRSLQDLGLRTSMQLSDTMVHARTRAGSMVVAAGIVVCVAAAFCVASFTHAYTVGSKSDKQEVRPVPPPRPDIISAMQAHDARFAPVPRSMQQAVGPSRQTTSKEPPSPRSGSSPATLKPFLKHLPSMESVGRLLSPEFVEPSVRPGAEEVVSGDEANHLCPELVVPEGSECTLMIPRVTFPGSNAAPAPISISDARGVPVFKATFASGFNRAGRKTGDTKRLVLTSATGDAVFSFCRETEVDPSTGQAGLAIFRHTDALFGELRADGVRPANGYSVSTNRGWRVRFRGDSEGRNLNATDDRGHLLAITESHGPARRSVRIGPLVDAGLVALTVLGIDILGQGFAESQRS